MDISLKGKNAFVCGGSQGIGKAIAIELAELGANVTVAARNENILQETIKDLSVKDNQTHTYVLLDFNNPESVAVKVNRLLKDKTYHILINNSGGPAPRPIQSAKAEEFIKAFNQHLIGNHTMATLLIPGMKGAGYGRIINIISTSVKAPLAGLGVSNTIRGSVASWAKTLSTELAPFGITVNNVLPGATKTGRLSSIMENKAEKQNKSKGEIEEEMKGEIPMGRLGEPHEIAAAATFLATPAAGYITGVSIAVDGGRTNCL